MNARANKYVKALTVSPDGAPATMPPGAVKPRFFKSGSEFGEWLAENHARVTQLIIGFYKKNAGKNWVTYHEALDAALAFGWIDGVRRSLDAQRWTIRFTPRSIWCLNMRTAGITKEVRMPVKSLQSSPSLKHLRHQARDLLKELQSSRPEAFARAREFHPKFARADDSQLRQTKFTLADAQLTVAREYGFNSWPKLKEFAGAAAPPATELSSLNAPGEVGTPEVLVARFLEYAKLFQFPIAYP